MKIGILGSGTVGTTLGSGLIRLGHTVMIGTGHPQKEALRQWLFENSQGGQIGSFSAAAAFGDIILLCTAWSGTKRAIEAAGIWNFKKKIVVDTTNPLDGKGPDEAGRLNLVPGNSASDGEQIQAWLQEAHVVKTLNTISSPFMMAPHLKDGTPTMFIAGNDDLAKKAITDLLSHMGWQDVADIGNIEMSRCLEALYVLWYAYGFHTGAWQHAFRLLRK